MALSREQGLHMSTPILFISYSHDSDEHRKRVLGLSERLRADGINTLLDQYVNGSPQQGWPRWMLDQLDRAGFVLVVCTETYYRRFRGHEVPDKGRGVDWEGAMMTQEIYQSRSTTLKFIPVLFSRDDERFIPEPLRAGTYYLPTSLQAYQDLYDFVLGQAGVEPRTIGGLKPKARAKGAPLTFDEERTNPAAAADPIDKRRGPIVDDSGRNPVPEQEPLDVPAPAQFLQEFATPALQLPRGNRPKEAKFRVIAFDLDGTLLRGLDFSWTLVWQYLKVPEAIWKERMRIYLTGKRTFQDYQLWCDSAYRHFRREGLKREQFREIASNIRLTVNLKRAVQILRDEGFIVAIISGGIDSLLKEMIPDAPSLFDYICINRLHFDDKDYVSGVDATPFDFAGKATGLEAICQAHRVTMEQSVFVGEGFNDEAIAGRAGLTIAYPPKADGFKWAAGIQVETDDLIEVINHVL
jgi:HAD superfamily phosphoserine phosphatase-like hydrolase